MERSEFNHWEFLAKQYCMVLYTSLDKHEQEPKTGSRTSIQRKKKYRGDGMQIDLHTISMEFFSYTKKTGYEHETLLEEESPTFPLGRSIAL